MSTRPFLEISAPETTRPERFTFSNLEIFSFERDGVYFTYNPALEVTGYDYKPEDAMKSFMVTLSELVSHTTANDSFEELLLELGWIRVDTHRYVGPDPRQLMETREQFRELIEGEGPYSRKLEKELPLPIHG